jgi:hypothetical protein
MMLERSMAKKRGRPASGKPWNEGKPARLDAAVVTMARAVAGSRGITMAEYLSDILRGPVGKDYAAMLRELEKGGEK